MSVFQTVAKKGILDAWGWLADDFRVVAVDSAYTFDSAHNFLDDVTDRVGISSLLASKTSTDGNAVSANPTITGPVSGPIAGCWLFRDTGVEATSDLIAWYDTTTNGQPMSVETGTADVILRIRDGLWFRI